MRSLFKIPSLSSALLLSVALYASAQPMITRNPCDSSVCATVPGVTNPPPGGSAVLSENFNSNNGGCTANDVNGPFEGPWTYNNGPGTWSTAGQGAELGRPPSTRLTCPAVTFTQAGNGLITFNHRYSFEYDGTAWDGGLVQVSINGGAFVTIPAVAFLQNGYNGAVRSDSLSEIHGQGAFIDVSAGYGTPAFITSIADIGCLSAGDTVSVRFLAAYDTNTRNGNPAWEIDSLAVIQGAGNGAVAEFVVSASANEALSFQWQRSSVGGAFTTLDGANSGFLAFAPTVADNGNCYRAIVTTSGGSVTSAVACLTVIQPNTPPRFTCGTNQVVTEDSGPQTVAGWATNIVAHSLPSLDAIIKFNALPPNSQLAGVATVSGGVLHLTDAGQNSADGSLSLILPATTQFQTFSASWKSRVGGGGGGGADGYSFNIDGNLPSPAEEGTTTGLAVTVDTWDNGTAVGGGDVVGIEIRWQGTRLASLGIPKDDDGSGNFLRRNTFVNASLTVDATGLTTFNYDGNALTTQIPSYTGITASRLIFAARTGGANDNHWIDDLTGGSWINNFLSVADNPALAEQGQTVNFLVSNDNPSLFSAQPAISPNGTLTYTPAPNACGVANVTAVARDNGGTNAACGGNDTSAPCTFTITITCANDCPTANPQTVNVSAGGTANFQLSGSDPDGDALQFQITQPPAHGVVVVNANSGAGSYSPAAGYTGPDSFRFAVRDGAACVSAPATVSISVGTANQPPTAIITAGPLADFLPALPNPVLVAANNWDACLLLDGSASSDPESGTNGLSYAWFVQPSPTPFATGITATNCLRKGTYTIVLVVTDSQGAAGTASLTVDVLNPCEAEGGLILLIQNSGLPRNVQQPLVSSVKAACASYEKFGARAGVNQLETFQNKVRVQVSSIDADLADQMIEAAQAIIDAINALNLK